MMLIMILTLPFVKTVLRSTVVTLIAPKTSVSLGQFNSSNNSNLEKLRLTEDNVTEIDWNTRCHDVHRSQ